MGTPTTTIDVRTIPPRNRHPKPLYYQFQMERSGQFTWEYPRQGPGIWQTLIRKKGEIS